MTANLKKLLKDALKYTQSGKLDKAIESYQEILKQTPKDTRALNNLGDLYLRKKMADKAANVFNTLAQIYDEDGYTLRAIAICQKAIKIDQESLPIRTRMAELYARQGLVAEAQGQYLDLADSYEKNGQVKEALDIFRKLADLDPKNLSVRVKLGNMFHKEGMGSEAVVEWVKVAEAYLKQNKTEDAVELLEKAVEADPGDSSARNLLAGEEIRKDNNGRAIELLRPLAEEGSAGIDTLKLYAAALLKEQDYEEASGILKQALVKEPSSLPIKENLGLALLKSGKYEEASEHLMKMISSHMKENRWEKAEKLAMEMRQANHDDTGVLQKLVEIYTHSRNTEMLASSYRELAGLYEKSGLKKNVLGIYQKLLEIEPDNAESQAKVGELQEMLNIKHLEVPAAAVQPEAAPAEEDDEIEMDIGVMAADVDKEEAAEVVSEADLEIETPKTPMAEVETLLKQGQFKTAETKLREMIMEQPTLEKLSMLKEIYRLQDKSGDYIEACFDVAGFLEGEGRRDDALREYQEILKVDQGNQRAKDAMADLVVEAGVDVKPAADRQEGVTVAEPAAENIIEIPEEDLSGISELDLAKLAGDLSIGRTAEAPPPPAVEKAASEPEPVLEPEPGKGPEELDELQAEADFYFQQGLLEEAEKLYRKILSSDTGRLDVASRLQEISAEDHKEGPASEEPFSLMEKDLVDFEQSLEIDLPQEKREVKFSVTSEDKSAGAVDRTGEFSDFLSDIKKDIEAPEKGVAVSSADKDLKELFQEFKQGVRENLSEEDYETHYNLGIAYKEMGLIDEALDEFDLAARGGAYYTDAISMMALCHKDNGHLEKAAGTIEDALGRLDTDDENRKGLYWELAGIYEEKGESQKAVDLYLSVYEIDDSYRGVKEKLGGLGALPGTGDKSTADEPVGGEGEVDDDTGVKKGPKKSTKVSYI